MRLTISIKALNEEKNIAASIESALAALEDTDGEIILADSDSEDATVEVAKRFPIRIVQLRNRLDRSCGAGAQLAFQYASGDYFYLLDGDMQVSRDFIAAALRFLEEHPDVAGVGGYVRERNLTSEDFQIRAQSLASDVNRSPGIVDRLEGGGLYRMAALREVVYFADRNLHSFEETELALRLRARGWKLARIDQLAADHFGYQMGGYRLLWHRIRSGYMTGVGEIIRASWGTKQFTMVFKELKHVRGCLLVIAWWLLAGLALHLSALAALALLVSPVAFLSARWRSPRLGLYSFVGWNVLAAGMIWGWLGRRVLATEPLAAVELMRGRGGSGAALDCQDRTIGDRGTLVGGVERSTCAF